MAKDSITELQNQLLIVRDVDFITEKIFDDIALKSVRVHKMVNGLIRVSKSKIRRVDITPYSKFEIPNSQI